MGLPGASAALIRSQALGSVGQRVGAASRQSVCRRRVTGRRASGDGRVAIEVESG